MSLTREQRIEVRRVISLAWGRVVDEGPVRRVKLARCCKASAELVVGSLMDAIHEEIDSIPPTPEPPHA